MAKTPTAKITTKKHLARVEKERRQTLYLLTGLGVVFLAVIGLIVYGILDQSVFKANRAVAQVGSQKITMSDFQAETRFSRYLMIRQYDQLVSNSILAQFYGQQIQQIESDLADPATVGKQALDKLVDDAAIEQEAKARNITITNAELETGLQEAFGFYASGTPTSAPTGTPYATATFSPTQLAWIPPTLAPTATATLAATTPTPAEPTATLAPTLTPTSGPTSTPFPTATAYTLDGYKNTFGEFAKNALTAGYDEAHLRAYIKRSLLKVKVYDEITKDTPKEEEKVWARHILVATEAEAKQVIDRLNKGEDFAKLAAELSTDTGSKTRGGDLGWFGTGVTDKDFEAAAYALKIGEISQPVKSQLGYHVIQLLGREVRPLTDSELSTKKQTAFSAWLTKAKEDLKVQIFDMWTQNVPSDPPFTPVPTTAQ